jgi:hypothetical protein
MYFYIQSLAKEITSFVYLWLCNNINYVSFPGNTVIEEALFTKSLGWKVLIVRKLNVLKVRN